jgi:hypothetical protein
MRVVYIAGKFRGKTPWVQELNVRAAEMWALDVWRMKGLAALCPHPMTRHYQGSAPDEVWLAGTLEMMRRCDAVYLVPGWRDSEGARKEKKEAEGIGLPVFETREELEAWHDGEGSP